MKTILFCFYIVFCPTMNTSVFGQKREKSLEVIALEYETLDSSQIKLIRPPKDLKGTSDFFIYSLPSDLSKNRIAYYTTDRNKWTSALLTVSHLESTNLSQINIDKKGQPEVVVKAGITSGCSQGTNNEDLIIIINIDKVPKQIFCAYYACSSRYFGELGSGSEMKYNHCEREIKISEEGIIVSPFTTDQTPFGGCKETNLPSGTYVMKDGQVKIKE